MTLPLALLRASKIKKEILMIGKIEHQFPPETPYEDSFSLNESMAKEFKRLLSNLNRFGSFLYILIKDSIIDQPVKDNTYVKADISNLIGQNKNLNLILTAEKLKEMKKISGPITIYPDNSENLYRFRTGHQSISFDSFDIDNNFDLPRSPSFHEEIIGNQVLIDNISDVRNYIRKTEHVYILIYKNQLEQIYIHGKESPYTFKNTGAGSLVGKNPDVVLICNDFLRMGEKKTTLSLAKNNEETWLITEFKFNLSDEKHTRIYQLLEEC
jgi:hypothetical protein